MTDQAARPGTTLNEWLSEEGLLEDATTLAIKSVIAFQLREAMREKGWTKLALSEQMQTSRAQLDRLLDPTNTSVTLLTLQKAAKAVGRQLRLELV